MRLSSSTTRMCGASSGTAGAGPTLCICSLIRPSFGHDRFNTQSIIASHLFVIARLYGKPVSTFSDCAPRGTLGAGRQTLLHRREPAVAGHHAGQEARDRGASFRIEWPQGFADL